MTKFVYIADSHVGAGETGYHQQPRYADRLPELIVLLDAWIQQNSDIDFVLHGGDMVDAVSDCCQAPVDEKFMAGRCTKCKSECRVICMKCRRPLH